MPDLSAVTFDCADALRLATFWAAVMRWDVAPDGSEAFAAVGGPNRPPQAPMMLFFHVDEPKVAKNRNHVDLHTSDLDAELTRIVGLGATVVHEKQEWGTRWFTLADPEGNEFCLVHDAAASV